MNRSPSACLIAAAAWVGLAAVPPSGPAAAAEGPVPLAAHHAVYRLSLLSSKGSSAPAAASGAIDYDFSGSNCDGYTTNFRQLVELQPQEGDSKLDDTRTNSYENDAGTDYTFDTRVSTDGGSSDAVAGHAKRGPDGRIAVDLKAPPGHADFAADVLLPTQHLRAVIAAAERGDKILSADVYDGSDTGRKLFHTLTVIGAPLTGVPDDAAGRADALVHMRRWPVVISYFGGDKDQPDYVLSSDLYEDGISRALKLDYGDFVLAGALDQLTMPPSPACKG